MSTDDLHHSFERVWQAGDFLYEEAKAFAGSANHGVIPAPTAYSIFSNLNTTLSRLSEVVDHLPAGLVMSLLDEDITVTDHQDPALSVIEAAESLFEATELLNQAQQALHKAHTAINSQGYVPARGPHPIPAPAQEIILDAVLELSSYARAATTAGDYTDELTAIETALTDCRYSQSGIAVGLGDFVNELKETLTNKVLAKSHPEDDTQRVHELAVEVWQEIGQMINRTVPDQQLYRMWREAGYPVSFNPATDNWANVKIESSMLNYLRDQVCVEQTARDVHATLATGDPNSVHKTLTAGNLLIGVTHNTIDPVGHHHWAYRIEDTSNGQVHTATDLRSGWAPSPNPDQAMDDLLGYLCAAGDAYQYKLDNPGCDPENLTLFPAWLTEAANQNLDELSMATTEVETNEPSPISRSAQHQLYVDNHTLAMTTPDLGITRDL